MKKILYFLITLLFFCVSAHATNYYVTQSGAGTQDGKSLGNAWSVATFNGTTIWSATEDANKIDPGDTVYFSGTITTRIYPRGSGTAGNVITLDGTSATTAVTGSSQISFGASGVNYITSKNFTIQTGLTLATEAIIIGGTNSGNISDNITIDGWTATNIDANGQGFIDTGYATNLTVQNCTVTGWPGDARVFMLNGSGVGCDTLLIKNNHFEHSSTEICGKSGTWGADMLYLGTWDNVTIEGNKIIMAYEWCGTDGSDPHSDIVQTYYNLGDDTRGAKNYTVRYNWLEIRSHGANRDNFGMLQDTEGTWKVYSNIFYSHSINANTSNGWNYGSYHLPSGSAYYLVGNTFVSKIDGIQPQTFFSPTVDDTSNTYIVNNNLFIQLYPNGVIASFGFPECDSAVYEIDNNGWYGGGTSAIKFNRCENSSQVSAATCASRVSGGTIGANNKCLSSEPLNVSSADFNLQADDTYLIDTGKDLSSIDANFAIYLSNPVASDFPNPTLATRTGNWDIGANEYGSSTPVTTIPQGVHIGGGGDGGGVWSTMQ